jgi:hypothetical protein
VLFFSSGSMSADSPGEEHHTNWPADLGGWLCPVIKDSLAVAWQQVSCCKGLVNLGSWGWSALLPGWSLAACVQLPKVDRLW